MDRLRHPDNLDFLDHFLSLLHGCPKLRINLLLPRRNRIDAEQRAFDLQLVLIGVYFPNRANNLHMIGAAQVGVNVVRVAGVEDRKRQRQQFRAIGRASRIQSLAQCLPASGDPIRARRSVIEGRVCAPRVTEQDRLLYTISVQKLIEIARNCLEIVACVRFVAQAMPTLIGRDDVKIVAKRGRDQVEHMAGRGQSMQQHQQRTAWITPFLHMNLQISKL